MDKRLIVVVAALLVLPQLLVFGQRKVNYDESAVAPYTLEDPLVFANGKKVRRNDQHWRNFGYRNLNSNRHYRSNNTGHSL